MAHGGIEERKLEKDTSEIPRLKIIRHQPRDSGNTVRAPDRVPGSHGICDVRTACKIHRLKGRSYL